MPQDKKEIWRKWYYKHHEEALRKQRERYDPAKYKAYYEKKETREVYCTL